MQQRRVIIVFALVVALSAAGYGVMFTVLDEMRSEYGIGEGALGLIVAIGFFASFLAQVLLAPFADRGFARRLVLVGMTLEIVGMLTMMVLAVRYDSEMYFEGAMLMVLFGFVGAVALAKFLLRGEAIE